MRRRWVSSVILMVVVGGSVRRRRRDGDVEACRSQDRRSRARPARAVVAGDILTVRASIQKLTTAGGAATSFKFLYTVSGGLKLLGITTNEGKYDRKTGRVALMQLRPGKPIVFTIRARVLAGRIELGRILCGGLSGRGLEGHEAREQRRRPAVDWSGHRRSRPTSASRSRTDNDLILRGSPNTYTVTATNRGPTTVTRLRLRVVTRLVSPSYDNAKGGYDRNVRHLVRSLARAWRPRHPDRLRYDADAHRNAHRDRRHLACCGLPGPCERKQPVDRQDHHRHPVGPTTIER